MLNFKIKHFYSVFILTLVTSLPSFNNAAFASPAKEGEELNAGELILHHVLDANEIHIADGLSIPLPMILITSNGLDIFSYGQFLDAHHSPSLSYTSTSTGNTYVYVHGDPMIVGPNGEEMAHSGWGVSKSTFMDLSISKNVIGIFLVLLIMFGVFMTVAKGYKTREGQAPKGLQSLMEPLVLFIRDEVAKPSIGKKYERFMPYLLSIFFFIWIGNLLGLVPFLGGMNITGNIAVTLTLATFTFLITSFSANKHYWIHVFNAPGVPWWLKFPVPLMPIVEIIGVLSKPFVLCLRLFANITAGHIIILSFTTLIFIFNQIAGPGTAFGVSIGTVLFSIFMTCLEFLVALLQAYVFTLLSALYFGMATEEHH